MGKKLNKNQMINELVDQFIVVEGEITDLLTRETMQNLNKRYGTNMNGVAVGSALLSQVGTAALSSYAASDEGIDVSDFALELMDDQGQKHYFKGCFPEVFFNKGDQVKVIALPYKPEYGYVSAIIDTEKKYMWTSQQVEKGMLRIRVFWMKFFGWTALFSLFLMFIFDVIASDGLNVVMFSTTLIQILSLIFLILFSFIGWRVGASFDEQSMELEAILNKLDFYKPTMMNLGKYSVYDVDYNNKVKHEGVVERWRHYTYRIDLAKQADEEKYGKKIK